MKYKLNLYLFPLLILIAGCTKEKNISSAEIIDLIHQDALSLAQPLEMTNSVELVYRPTNTEVLSFAEYEDKTRDLTSSVVLVSDPLLAEEEKPVKKIRSSPKKTTPSGGNRFVKPGAYIKVGNDVSGQLVSPRSAKKITSVVVTGGRSVYMDIYLYAIPQDQPLVRNSHTLIGFIKELDVINNQVQFTKFWDARLVQGRFLNPGYYNIYIFYSYKDKNKKEILSSGRFWGGDHRRWVVKVL